MRQRGRLRARDVEYLVPEPARPARPGVSRPSTVRALFAAGLFLSVLAAAAASGLAPWGVLGAYSVLSVVTFLIYGLDKRAAEKGRWRTAESTLHMLALTGGWPGALVAQRVFRHKTKKQPFQSIFWLTIVANIGVLVLLLSAVRGTIPPV